MLLIRLVQLGLGHVLALILGSSSRSLASLPDALFVVPGQPPHPKGAGCRETLNAIADKLNAEAVPTAKGRNWYPSTVAHLLPSVTLDRELTDPKDRGVPRR